MDLSTPLEKVGRAYKMYAKRLQKLNIFTLSDLIFHIPFRYDNYSVISKINIIQAGETVTLQGVVDKIDNQYLRGGRALQKAKISDETGSVDVIWFNQSFLTRIIKVGDKISLSGKIGISKNKLTMQSPEYEVIYENNTIHTGRLVPVYPETKGVSSKWLRRQIYNLLKEESTLEEYLPEKIISDNNLLNLSDAIRIIHFPNTLTEAETAKNRLSFDELFKLHLSSLIRKRQWQKKQIKKPFNINISKVDGFVKKIPFELTSAQKNSVSEIINDLSSQKPMNRLLQGDVGSGKTVVATIAMYIAYLNGYQSAFMAPTEILANQHYRGIKELMQEFGVKVEILTGSNKSGVKNDFDILIGTHTLVYKNAQFKKLGLIIIDEQQRFGVEQRGIIRQKGENPHLLTMTATPIPRTVALTMYGDLDLSILNEMPKGRRIIKTWLVPPEKREGAYNWINKKIKQEKDQVFIVCPFIEESETLATVKAAKVEFEKLKNHIFPNLKLGLLHGKLKSKEKDEVLKLFKEGKIDILVSTPVVEVGIDISNATIMLIEEGDRFGLAQLHQLRGRVGRGDKQSYCLLFSSSKNPQTLQRLKALETMNSGAELAELDLKLRGPGEIFGTSQHGIPNLKVASFSDYELIEKTKKEALKIFDEIEKYPELNKKIKELNTKQVSPD